MAAPRTPVHSVASVLVVDVVRVRLLLLLVLVWLLVHWHLLLLLLHDLLLLLHHVEVVVLHWGRALGDGGKSGWGWRPHGQLTPIV